MGTTVDRGGPWWVALALVALCTLAAPVIAGQRQGATLEGLVQDSNGASVAGMVVTLRQPDTNLTRTTRTDADGSFRLVDLPVGTYEVRVEGGGFAPYTHAGVTLAIGQTARLLVVVHPPRVVEDVTVSAQPPPLDSRQTSIATVIDTEHIEELPVRSRNYLEFVLLAPGVTRAAPPAGAGTMTSVLPGSGFSFQGLRPGSNTLTIDGIDNTDEFSGSSRTELSLEVVREFQVVQNGWSAENGGAGGAINVVTRSGANTLHGDAFLFGQSGALDARPKLEETQGVDPALRRYRAGGAVGGPIARDRTFYYAGAEREGTRDQTASDIRGSAAAAINAALASGLMPEIATRQLATGVFPTARRETEASLKLTNSFATRGLLVGEFAANQNGEDHDAFNSGGLSDRSARGSATTRDLAASGSWTTALAASTAHELRGQFAARRQLLQPADRLGSGVSVAGVANFGAAYVGDSERRQLYVDISDTLTHSRGQHLLKLGAGMRRVAISGHVADGVHGLYTFRSLPDFLAGRIDSTRRISADVPVAYAVVREHAFLQDHWTPSPTVTVDAGLRLDATQFPSALAMSGRQLGPRAGVAWTAAPHWVVRAGAGRFADRTVLAAIERPVSAIQHGLTEQIVSAKPASAASLFTVRRGGWNPASVQASVGAEHLVTSNLTAAVTYLYASGRRLPRTVNVNLPPPSILTLSNAASLGVDAPSPQQLGRPVFGPERLNPSWDAIFELQPNAGSTYHGVTAALNRRLTNEIAWSAAYTWSHTRDSASDYDEQPQNPYALAEEWADSRFDQRHHLVASALFDLPIGDEEDRQPGHTPGFWTRAFSHIEIAPILTLGSGTPVNVTTGADDNRTGAFPFTARPLGSARNLARLPSSATFDVRLLKFFNIKPHGKFDVVVEAFNLLNRTNVSQLNAVYGPLLAPLSSFGRPLEAGLARQFQLSIDFEF